MEYFQVSIPENFISPLCVEAKRYAGQFLIRPVIRHFLFQYWKLVLPDDILSTIIKCNKMTGCIRLFYAAS
jgi:hypothetical protein